MVKVAINGLGRIGRATFRMILETPQLDLVAVNDLVPIDNLAYLLQYDTVYGKYKERIEVDGDRLVVNGKRYRVFSQRDPALLPWGELGIDVVFECTGVFTRKEGLEKHLQAGAKFVVLSAPAKSEDIGTVVHGVNQPGEESVALSVLRQLHHELHRPRGGDHGSEDRDQEGDHDDDPRLHVDPRHRGRPQQEVQERTNRGGQSRAHNDRSRHSNHQGIATVHGQVRRGGCPRPGSRGSVPGR